MADVEEGAVRPKAGVVWLASYPKSGNTWTRAFLANLATIIDGKDEPLELNSIGRFTIGENIAQLYRERLGFAPTGSEDDRRRIAALRHEIQQQIADHFEGLLFVKTHNAMIVDRGFSLINFHVTAGAIYIVRNPLDVAISLSHHMGGSIDEAIATMASPFLETQVSEKKVYEVWGSWSQHVMSWTRKPHRAIYVMRYEDMLSDPERIFGGLADHLLLGQTQSQLREAVERSSFEALQDQEELLGFDEKPEKAERFFREGRAGQWKELLTPAQIDRIVCDHGEQMARFGYLPP